MFVSALTALALLGAQAHGSLAAEAAALENEALERAANLIQAPAAPAVPPGPDETISIRLDAFALAAAQAARSVEANGGATDLSCIYRGMSEDAEVRAEAIGAALTRADQARAYRDLADLAEAARRISEEEPSASAAPSRCPAIARP